MSCHHYFSYVGVARLEYWGILSHSTSMVALFSEAQRVVEKGCLGDLAYIQDTSKNTPTIDLVPVVRMFSDDR